MENTIKARKVHTCVHCDGNIQAGETHKQYKSRIPKYANDDCIEGEQIGVEYIDIRWHIRDCVGALTFAPEPKEAIKRCHLKGEHEWKEETEFDHYADYNRVYIPTGEYYCKNCGIKKELS